MKRKIFILILGFIVISTKLIGQEIRGMIVDSESELPLAYVNIGVANISHGTVTNEYGEYILDCEILYLDYIFVQ